MLPGLLLASGFLVLPIGTSPALVPLTPEFYDKYLNALNY